MPCSESPLSVATSATIAKKSVPFSWLLLFCLLFKKYDVWLHLKYTRKKGKRECNFSLIYRKAEGEQDDGDYHPAPLCIGPVKVYTFELAVVCPTRRARPVDFEGYGFGRRWGTDRTGMLASSGGCQRTSSHALQGEPTQRCDQRNDREETAYLVHDTPLSLLFKQKMLLFHLPLPLQGICSQSNGPIAICLQV